MDDRGNARRDAHYTPEQMQEAMQKMKDMGMDPEKMAEQMGQQQTEPVEPAEETVQSNNATIEEVD